MNEPIESIDTMEAYCHSLFDLAHNKWSEQGASALTKNERLTLSVETFYGELMNGGFYQYLTNESGAFVNWAPEGLRTIGLPEYASFVSRVIDLFPESRIPEDYDERFERIEEIDEDALQHIEDDFWDFYEDDKRIRLKLYEYLKNEN